MTDIEAAWVAGVFEGEGCIYFCDKNSVRLSIKMTDRDVVERVHAIAGVGSVRPGGGTNKLAYTWSTNRADYVEALLHALLPFFGERRRAKALAALERLANCHRRGREERNPKPCQRCGEAKSPGSGRRLCDACPSRDAMRLASRSAAARRR